MINFKFLQKLFFLLVMGFSLCAVQACGDDEENEAIQDPNEEENVKPDNGKEEEKPKDTMEAVDLGLSSGTLWATCNVGASSPEESGDYYAWGEIKEKDTYSWETYIWCDGAKNTFTKYCSDSENGIVDNKKSLESSDDIVYIKWGSNWCMPTATQFKELCNECSWEWTTYNDVNGQLVTGPNGNSIFLPATGRKYGSHVSYFNSEGYYLSATLLDDLDSHMYILFFNDGEDHTDPFTDDRLRCTGHTVRPVMNNPSDN